MSASAAVDRQIDSRTATIILGAMTLLAVWFLRRSATEASHYSMVIEWSEEDRLFVVSLPEWGPYAKTHGATYDEAARAGHEVLEMLIQNRKAQGRPMPKLTPRYAAAA